MQLWTAASFLLLGSPSDRTNLTINVSQAWPGPMETHWYEPSNPPGLEIFTHDTRPWMAHDAIGLRYTGLLPR